MITRASIIKPMIIISTIENIDMHELKWQQHDTNLMMQQLECKSLRKKCQLRLESVWGQGSVPSANYCDKEVLGRSPLGPIFV